jgi:hypothetical protein
MRLPTNLTVVKALGLTLATLPLLLTACSSQPGEDAPMTSGPDSTSGASSGAASAAGMKRTVDRAVGLLVPALTRKFDATPGYLHGQFEGCAGSNARKYVAAINLDRRTWLGTGDDLADALTALDWTVDAQSAGVSAGQDDMDIYADRDPDRPRLTLVITGKCHALSAADEAIADDDPGTDYPELAGPS